jgi:hypothetical protein
MKNFFRLFGLIAIVAVIGFSFTACKEPEDKDEGKGGGGQGSGSTREKAILVTVGDSSSHTISSSGEHWFKFTGTSDPVIFETTGDVVDTYMVVDTLGSV